jgi:NTE family protein
MFFCNNLPSKTNFCLGKELMHRARKVIAMVFILFLADFSSTAASQDEPKRPVVGLALSGGGSLGLAEIGVLRYLEEHRIPVDVIAGTSIGGLLGGLYATGHDAAFLEKFVDSADWNELLRASARFENLSVAEKQDWNRIKGVYSIPLRKGLALPGGVNTGQALVRFLSGETSAYWDVQDFDDLPIPFRCVATDLISGEAFVLRDGHLVEALRATMAIPGIFTPLERDGRLLVDGGVVNNLPTNLVKDMGADVIVAVTLRAVTPAGGDLQNLPDVVRRAAELAVVQNEIQQARLADIVLAIPVPNAGLIEFSSTSSLIEAGYQTAVRNASILEKLSLSGAQWQAYQQNRRSRERKAPELGPLISVTAGDPTTQRSAALDLNRKTNSEISRSELEAVLSSLTATSGLPNAYYGWHSESGKSGYQVKLEPRPAAETMITPSLFYQLSSGEPGRPTFRLAGTTVLKNAYKSKFLGAIEFGSNLGVFFEYYHPFDGTGYFIAPGLTVERTHFYNYTGEDRSDETRSRGSASLFFGMGTWRHLQLRIGGRAGADHYSAPAIVDGIASLNTTFVNPEIKAIINTQDSGLLPSRGFRLNAAAGWSFREHSFPYIEMSFDHFQPLGKQFTWIATGRTDTSLGTKLGFYDQFTAGGLNDMDAYRYQEIRGDTVLMGGSGILYRGANLHGRQFRPIFGTWYQIATADVLSGDLESRQSAALGIFTPTPLGIAGATFSFDLKGTMRFRLSLGSFWNRP